MKILIFIMLMFSMSAQAQPPRLYTVDASLVMDGYLGDENGSSGLNYFDSGFGYELSLLRKLASNPEGWQFGGYYSSVEYDYNGYLDLPPAFSFLRSYDLNQLGVSGGYYMGLFSLNYYRSLKASWVGTEINHKKLTVQGLKLNGRGWGLFAPLSYGMATQNAIFKGRRSYDGNKIIMNGLKYTVGYSYDF